MTSDTLVLQSHSWRVLRGWIGRCADSVRAWTEAKGYDYRFLGDEIFDVLPPEYRSKLTDRLQIQADLARLLLIQIALDEGGYRRAVWFDADVLVWDADGLTLDDINDTCAFGRETWIAKDKNGKPRSWRSVHNAFCLFERRDPVLPFLIHTTQRIISRIDPEESAPQVIGPKLLTALDGLYEFAALDRVGAFSPDMISDIAQGGGPAVDAYHRALTRADAKPPCAANLCGSLIGDEDTDAITGAMRQLLDRGFPD